MNSFSNDGSFLERFKKNSDQRIDSKSDQFVSTNYVNAQKPNLIGSSLSAQLIGKTSKFPSNVSRCSKIINEKPKIFDDSIDDDQPELDPKTKEIAENLARSVALTGDKAEQSAKERNSSNPAYWFLNDKNSEAYKYYAKLIDDNRKMFGKNDSKDVKVDLSIKSEMQRKRKSRWDDSKNDKQTSIVAVPVPSSFTNSFIPVIPRSPPVMVQQNVAQVQQICSFSTSESLYSKANCAGSSTISQLCDPSTSESKDNSVGNINELDIFQKQILASQLAAKALARAARAKEGKTVNEYDSDEDVDGGTFEHKKRMQEMERTKEIAQQLTKQATGKHHIGDFLPLEETEKFYNALKKTKDKTSPDDKSEYQDNKLQEDNVGFKLLQKMGWNAGKGLGANEQGITAPVNKGRAPNDMQGLGSETSTTATEDDDLFDVYRKRMMLAYRFRPNPLNNPRRPYY